MKENSNSASLVSSSPSHLAGGMPASEKNFNSMKTKSKPTTLQLATERDLFLARDNHRQVCQLRNDTTAELERARKEIVSLENLIRRQNACIDKSDIQIATLEGVLKSL